MQRLRFNPWVGKFPWRNKWQPTLVFLHGGLQGQKSLAGNTPWGHKELDMIEQLTPLSTKGVDSLKQKIKKQRSEVGNELGIFLEKVGKSNKSQRPMLRKGSIKQNP